MSNTENQITITVTGSELEALLRRIVREELTRLIEAQRPSLLDSWGHEGPDDVDGDAALLADVLWPRLNVKRPYRHRASTGQRPKQSWRTRRLPVSYQSELHREALAELKALPAYVRAQAIALIDLSH